MQFLTCIVAATEVSAKKLPKRHELLCTRELMACSYAGAPMFLRASNSFGHLTVEGYRGHVFPIIFSEVGSWMTKVCCQLGAPEAAMQPDTRGPGCVRCRLMVAAVVGGMVAVVLAGIAAVGSRQQSHTRPLSDRASLVTVTSQRAAQAAPS